MTKKNRIEEDLERGLDYIDEALIDSQIKQKKIDQFFGSETYESGRTVKYHADGTEILWTWWDKHYPSTM